MSRRCQSARAPRPPPRGCSCSAWSIPMSAPEILAALRAQADPKNVAGMARYGISTAGTLGVPVAEIRRLAKQVGRSHSLAAELWASGIHEARILATIVDEPARVTRRQMNQWARDFDSWDVCDQACQNLFRYTPYAWTDRKSTRLNSSHRCIS